MALPDEGNVEAYSEEEFKELLAKFATDKASLTKKQMAAVARYNFKLGKGEAVVYRGQAGVPAPAAPAASAADAPTAGGATVAIDPALIPLLPPEIQVLAKKDPASLTKDEKIALAKAKSQAVKAQSAAPAAAAAAPDAPKGPSPEEIAREKALAFLHAQKMQAKFGDAIEQWSMQVYAPYATVKAERILDVVKWLKDEQGFDYLRNLTAVDWPPERMEVVYNLFEMRSRSHLAIRVKVPRVTPDGSDLPHLPSIVSVHPGADWLEREVFDLFGIRFDGHPYMRRLMMPDDWVGHPLRKDYDSKKEQFVGLGADGRDIVSFDPSKGW